MIYSHNLFVKRYIFSLALLFSRALYPPTVRLLFPSHPFRLARSVGNRYWYAFNLLLTFNVRAGVT